MLQNLEFVAFKKLSNTQKHRYSTFKTICLILLEVIYILKKSYLLIFFTYLFIYLLGVLVCFLLIFLVVFLVF